MINRTLDANRDIIGEVVSGRLKGRQELTLTFDTVTGREAYRSHEFEKAKMRDTNAVKVIIEADASARGFGIFNAFPVTLPQQGPREEKSRMSVPKDFPGDWQSFASLFKANWGFYDYYDSVDDWLADQARGNSKGRDTQA